MELLTKVIVYPILGIVYVALPCLSRTHPPLLSFMPAFSYTVSYWRHVLEAEGHLPQNFFCYYLGGSVLAIIAGVAGLAGAGTVFFFLFDFFVKVEEKYDLQSLNEIVYSLLISLPEAIVAFLPFGICMVSLGIAFYGLLVIVFGAIVPTVLLITIDCLVYLLSPLSYPVTRVVVRIIIFGLKNRRACQFLSGLAAVVLGVTKAPVYAAIPISFGILLSVPDLEPDPWVDFKLRFAKFLEANMDAESVDAFVNSTSFKLVSCNEMMPELGPARSITPAASFVFEQVFSSSVNEHFTVEAEYRIGLGSITTSTRGDVINVQVITPFSGVKNRTIANTARSRYNLDMSARFWKEHPHVGILNKAFQRDLVYEVGQLHCIGVDKWIKLCGSEYHVFVEYDSEL